MEINEKIVINDQVFIHDGVETCSYFALDKTHPVKQVIFFEKGKVFLRRFDSLPLSTMTSVAYLEGKIHNMEGLYNTLVCMPEITDDKLVFVEPGVMTSIRYKEGSKGRRIGYFDHGICIAVWNGRKEIKCKIFRRTKEKGNKDVDAVKLQLTGVDDVTGKEVALMVAKQMSEAANFYDYIINNIDEYEQTIIGFLTCNHGPEIDVILKQKNEWENEKKVQEQYLNWPNPNSIPDKYQRLAIGVMQRCTDLRYKSEILPRAKKILENNKPCDNDMNVYSVRRAMSKYNYTLGFRVNRLELAKYLIEVGYNACYFNEIVEYVFVPVSDEVLDVEGTVRREPGRDNQFEIFESGKIKHSGTGSVPTEQTYICLMLDIIRGVDRFGIFPGGEKFPYNENDLLY